MGIVIMNPEEPGSRLRSVPRGGEPAEDRVGGRIRKPFDIRCAAEIVPFGQMVVIRLEPAIEAEPTIQREPGNESGGGIPSAAEILGHLFHRRRQDETALVPKAMPERRLAGED